MTDLSIKVVKKRMYASESRNGEKVYVYKIAISDGSFTFSKWMYDSDVKKLLDNITNAPEVTS